MSKAEDFWDSSASNYDKTEERFEYIHSKSRLRARRHLKGSDVVLDYGCGTGTTSCELSSQVKEIHAIDISSRMLEIAKEKADAGNIENVEFVQAEIFDERYEEESFDVILAFNVLHTVPDPQSAIGRMHGLLKPAGLLISVTPCFRDKISGVLRIQILLVQVLCKLGIIPIPIRPVKSSNLDELMKNGGFQITDTEKIFRGVSSYFLVAQKIGHGRNAANPGLPNGR